MNIGISAKTLSRGGAALGLAIVVYFVAGAFVQAAAEPIITATIRDSSENVITNALVGANVHSVVQVASSTGPTPQGTVDFNVYSNTSCTGTPTTQADVALVQGFATSSATAVPSGGLSYKVHYDGDVNNVAADGACVPLSAKNISSISTTLSSSSIQVGSSVHDAATLSGATANATGTVAYTVFTNSSCSTPYGGAGIVNVTNGAVPNSPPFQFATRGTYYWQAVYSGDQNNTSATSTCTQEILTVTAAPTQSGRIVVDKVTDPAGDAQVFSFIAGGGSSYASFNLADTSAPNDQLVNVGSYSVNESAISGWTLTSSVCGKNGLATSTYTPGTLFTIASNDVVRCIFTNTKNATTTPPPPAGAGTINGTVYNDKNGNDVRDSGEEGLPGFTIKLYDSPNFSGDYWPIFQSATTDSNGNYSFTGLANGTYSVEQLKKEGWQQTTDDFASVSITGGAGVGGRDFANVQRGQGNDDRDCKEKKGKGKHNKHCEDEENGNDDDDEEGNNDDDDDNDDSRATSTKPWWRNEHDNGKHLGWLNDELGTKIRAKVEAKLQKAFDRWDD